MGRGGPVIQTQLFRDQENLLQHPNTITRNMANALMSASTTEQVYNAMVNMTGNEGERPFLSVPIYHRAFPTHRYEQAVYWHGFGSMITTTLIVFFSLPAAVTSGAFRREIQGGQIDVLSTLPGVLSVYSAAAWCVCCAVWTLFSACVCWLFFFLVLDHSYSYIPALCLLLCGLALGPMSTILGNIYSYIYSPHTYMQ